MTNQKETTKPEAAQNCGGPVDPLVIPAFERYSQGIMSDGPVILCEGQPMTPEDIVAALNRMTDALAFYANTARKALEIE